MNLFNSAAGAGPVDTIRRIALQDDGKILISGSFTTVDHLTGVPCNKIARLNTNGFAEKVYHPYFEATGIETIAVQPDGKVLVGGLGFWIGSDSRIPILRFRTDDSEDTSFTSSAGLGPACTGGDPCIYALALQPDGKILVGGIFDSYNADPSYKYLVRLNYNGSLDTSFNPAVNATVRAITVTPETGKILIGGEFDKVNKATRNRIARLNANGKLDNSFDPGLGANNTVFNLTAQPGGKVLVGGIFDSYNADPSYKYLVRLNYNGSLDTIFNPAVNATVRAITVAPDTGKIFIGGEFTSVCSVARNRIARLNTNSTLDNSFDPGTGASSTVLSLVLQNNDKIIIGGQFTAVDSVTRNHLAQLSNNGALDPDFDPNVNNHVNDLAVQKDGHILVGGIFTQIGTVTRNCLARLSEPAVAIDNLSSKADGSKVCWMMSGSKPKLRRVTFELSTDGTNYVLLGEGSSVAGGWELTGLTLPLKQDLYIRARGVHGSGVYNNSTSLLEAVRYCYLVPLTIPAAPTNVSATAGTHSDKVVITWTKSPGATGYQVWRDDTALGWLGDVAEYIDFNASATIITHGRASASDGASNAHVALTLSGSFSHDGPGHNYRVVARNDAGESVFSDLSPDCYGYRGTSSLAYQRQRSAGVSDGDYSLKECPITKPYSDTGAPRDGRGRYKYRVSAGGAGSKDTNPDGGSDEGYRLVTPKVSVATDAANGIGDSSATLNMNFTLGDNRSVDVRFAYRATDAGNWRNTDWALKDRDGSYSFTLTGLSTGKDYEFKAQLKHNSTQIEGYPLQFSTNSIITVAVSSVPEKGGTVSGGGDYALGVPVTVKAAASPGYEFVKWTEDGLEVSTANPYNFNAAKDCTMTVNFTATPSFSDVSPDHGFYPYIEAIYAEGITTGFSDGSYRPNKQVTRGQMAAFIARALNLDTSSPPATPSFPDVPSDHSFYAYIEAIYKEGISTGYSDGEYKPNNVVTRGQIAAFLSRALKLHNKEPHF